MGEATVADTAFSIALVRAEERLRPEPERLFDDPYAGLFAAAGAHVQEATQRLLDLPFMREGVRIRTRAIDDLVREGLAEGVRQVVLLGAGFDARALRLPEIPQHGARVFEVDFADQLERKRAILRQGGVVIPGHVVPVPCDFMAPKFEDDLTRRLDAAGFRRGGATVFVWEGVISYIGVAEIDRSLRWMAHAGGRGSRLVFDYMDAFFEPRTASEHVLAAGFTRFLDVGYDVLWRRLLTGDPHEHAAVIRLGTAFV